MKLELLHESAKGDAKATPILFVHGKWHGAWCRQYHFMPYFAQNGYDVYAISLRGHGNSEGSEKLRRRSISDYVEDVHWAVNEIGKTLIRENTHPCTWRRERYWDLICVNIQNCSRTSRRTHHASEYSPRCDA